MENVIIALVAFVAGVIATRLYMTVNLKKEKPSDIDGGGSVDVPKDNNEHQTT